MSENEPTQNGSSQAEEQPRKGKPAAPLFGNELRRILSLEIPVIAVMAEKTMRLKEILNLTVGSIIQLDKPAEELLDLMVNDQRIGRGETVRVGENFGLHLLELGPLRETILKLGKSVEPAELDHEQEESGPVEPTEESPEESKTGDGSPAP